MSAAKGQARMEISGASTISFPFFSSVRRTHRRNAEQKYSDGTQKFRPKRENKISRPITNYNPQREDSPEEA